MPPKPRSSKKKVKTTTTVAASEQGQQSVKVAKATSKKGKKKKQETDAHRDHNNIHDNDEKSKVAPISPRMQRQQSQPHVIKTGHYVLPDADPVVHPHEHQPVALMQPYSVPEAHLLSYYMHTVALMGPLVLTTVPFIEAVVIALLKVGKSLQSLQSVVSKAEHEKWLSLLAYDWTHEVSRNEHLPVNVMTHLFRRHVMNFSTNVDPMAVERLHLWKYFQPNGGWALEILKTPSDASKSLQKIKELRYRGVIDDELQESLRYLVQSCKVLPDSEKTPFLAVFQGMIRARSVIMDDNAKDYKHNDFQPTATASIKNPASVTTKHMLDELDAKRSLQIEETSNADISQIRDDAFDVFSSDRALMERLGAASPSKSIRDEETEFDEMDAVYMQDDTQDALAERILSGAQKQDQERPITRSVKQHANEYEDEDDTQDALAESILSGARKQDQERPITHSVKQYANEYEDEDDGHSERGCAFDPAHPTFTCHTGENITRDPDDDNKTGDAEADGMAAILSSLSQTLKARSILRYNPLS